MKKRYLPWLLLYLVLVQISTVFATTALEPPAVEAQSAILIDASTGKILYEKEINQKHYPASITKLMTVLLALKYGKLHETMTFSKEAVFGIERNSSHIAIDVGEQITLEQGLYAIMLASANEVSLGVAEHIDGSIEAFAKHMNEQAKELGCKNTNFVNSNGLHNENHYTTAYDMVLIAKELLKFDFFKQLMATTYYEIPPTNKNSGTRYLYAQHKMIKENSNYFYEGCEGGKTGFTNEAQHTLVTYAKKGDTELIAVVLKDTASGLYKDTIALMDYGFSGFETVLAFNSTNYSVTKPVTQTFEENTLDAGEVEIYAKNNIYATVSKNNGIGAFSQKIILDDFLTVPIHTSQKVGYLQIYSEDTLVGETELLAKTDVLGIPEEELLKQKKQQQQEKLRLLSLWSGVCVLSATLVLYFIRWARNEKRNRQRRRRFHQRYHSGRRYS